jgi:hypothetical protein
MRTFRVRDNIVKSSVENLKRRGKLSDKDYQLISNSIEKNISLYLNSPEAYLRTSALRYIKLHKDDSFLPKLYEMIKYENVLYTKIELCDCLVFFGEQTIKELVPLLGKVGTNQHKEIGNYDLEKKSYPLPRDIVGRILIRMGPVVFKYLKDIFERGDLSETSEAIDVIGHISFNYNDETMEDRLMDEYHKNKNSLIRWKLIRAFQSFSSKRVIQILENIERDGSEDLIIRKEAERSLKRITERNPVISDST